MQGNKVTKIMRLNLKYATHSKINDKLKQLNPSYYKSQNEFMIQALLFYINALESEEKVTKIPLVIEKPFVEQSTEFTEKKKNSFFNNEHSFK